MKTLATLYTMCLLAQLSSAQTSPEFHFTLYATDALGNRDSVILGYDPMATDDIDTFFGEIDITNVPYDSVFEMRAGSSDLVWNGSEMTVNSVSKTQIIELGGSSCQMPAGVINVSALVIRAKYAPITFSWNPSLFALTPQNDCRDWSAIVNQSFYTQAPAFFTPRILHQFPGGTVQETFSYPNTVYTSYLVDINNGSSDTVKLMYFVFSSKMITTGLEKADESPLKLKYSIQQGQLIIENEALSVSTIRLYDVLGTSLSVSNNHVIDVSGLLPGIYFAQIETDKGMQTIKVFLPGG